MVIKFACLKDPKRYACRVLALLGPTMLVRTKDSSWLPCLAFGKLPITHLCLKIVDWEKGATLFTTWEKGTSYVDICFCGRFSFVDYSFKSVTRYPQLPRKAECIFSFVSMPFSVIKVCLFAVFVHNLQL